MIKQELTKLLIHYIIGFYIIIVIPTVGFGKTIHVPDEFLTIQEALNRASTGDIIQVKPGVYQENIQWPNVDRIKLIGSGKNSSIIDGNQKDSVIRFDFIVKSITSDTLIKGFKITNGRTAYGDGAGIFCKNSNPTISNINIIDNLAISGSGIFCYNSNLILTNINISNNWADRAGGGILCESSNLILSNVNITNNRGSEGGGIFCSNSKLKFDIENRCNIYSEEIYPFSETLFTLIVRHCQL